MISPDSFAGGRSTASSKAPTPEAHLRHFMATVADYRNLEAAFPLTTELPFVGEGADRGRWILALHAMVLRKYFAPKDQLRLPLVIDSTRGLTCGVELSIDWTTVEEKFGAVEDLMDYSVGGKTYSDSQILEKRLYGRLLHGDHDKWTDEGNMEPNLSDFAVVVHIQAMALYVCKLADGIDELEQLGKLSYRTQMGPGVN